MTGRLTKSKSVNDRFNLTASRNHYRSVPDAKDTISDEEVDRYRHRASVELCDIFNGLHAKFADMPSGTSHMPRLRAKPDFDEVEEHLDDDGVDFAWKFARACKEAENNSKATKGIWSHKQTVDAAFQVLAHLFGPNPKEGVALDMPVRAGKSDVINMVSELIHPFMKSFGIDGEVVTVPYSMLASIADMKMKLFSARAIYPKIYVEGCRKPLHSICPRDIDKTLMSRGRLGLWRQFLSTIAPGKTLYVLLDEADYGSAIHGRINKIMQLGRERNINIKLVAVSATAWEFRNAAKLNLVSITIPPGVGYSGLFDGDWIKIKDWSTLAKEKGLPDLCGKFRSRIDGVRLAPHAAQLVRHIFDVEKCKVAVVRYDNGVRTKEFERQFAKLNKKHRLGITIVPHYKDECKKSIQEQLAAHPGRVLVVVQGHARRANEYRGCSVFVDFTAKPSTQNALEQGFLGRASGWDKPDSIVYLSHACFEQVKRSRDVFSATGDKPRAYRVLRGIEMMGDEIRNQHHLKEVSSFVLRRDTIEEGRWNRIVRAFESNVIDHLYTTKGDREIMIRSSHRLIYQHIALGGRENMRMMELDLRKKFGNSVRFLRSDEKRQDGAYLRGYNVAANGKISLSVNNQGRRHGGDDKVDRDARRVYDPANRLAMRGNLTFSAYFNIQMNGEKLLIDDEHRPTLERIVVQLAQPITMPADSNVVASSESFFSLYHSDEQNDLRDNALEANRLAR